MFRSAPFSALSKSATILLPYGLFGSHHRRPPALSAASTIETWEQSDRSSGSFDDPMRRGAAWSRRLAAAGGPRERACPRGDVTCPDCASRFRCPSTASSPDPTRAWTSLWGLAACVCTNGRFLSAAWRALQGLPGGEVNESTPVFEESLVDIGATVMGRNMFGGHPGPWDANRPWNGWWGPNPPFHHPVFVLSHYARAPLVLDGGTTFTFVTEGIDAALEQARRAAGRRTSRSPAGRTPPSNISRRDSSTRWRSISCRRSSAAASGCSMASVTISVGSRSCGRSPRRGHAPQVRKELIQNCWRCPVAPTSRANHGLRR